MFRVALTTDVSRMYCAVRLQESENDFHRFVWRKEENEPLVDYRMTRYTFGVSSSSFVANMCVKQNTADHESEYPLAAAAVRDSYVDDGLVGADTLQEAMDLQSQLQQLFSKAGFLLRKWRSSNPAAIEDLSSDLRDTHSSQTIPDTDGFSKTLGIEWNAGADCFRLTVSDLPSLDSLTKRSLVSDIAKTFDVLG